MKILIIFTGGTIGSSVNNGTISPDQSTKYLLVENYKAKAKTKDNVIFETTEPYAVLSENLSAENINLLIKTIKENLDGGYDGIIVTHGTDTIQFTAAALGYAFGGIDLPIILVSSNYPLSEKGANGEANFEASVKFIADGVGKGVFAAYANGTDRVDFHCANALLMHRETSDSLYSLNDNVFASYQNGSVVLISRFTDDAISAKCREFKLTHDSQILVVNCYPGSSYDFSLDKYKAVILRPYHSGTLNTDSSEFVSFCSRVKKRNIPMYVVNVPPGNAYESTAKYAELGIITLPFCTFASVYMKLWIDISENSDSHVNTSARQ